MRNVKQSNVNIHRDSWVEINLDYLAQNIKAIRSQTPKDVKLLAVVKADAYGHGAVMLAPTLLASGADMLGVASIDEGADLRNAKISGNSNRGILVCGTGIGMSIAANKVRGIRAALCGDTYSARVSRAHNNANILCLGERVIGEHLALGFGW